MRLIVCPVIARNLLCVYVIVDSAPVITTVLQNQSVITGDSVRFECVATGAPQPAIHWYRGRSTAYYTGTDGMLCCFMKPKQLLGCLHECQQLMMQHNYEIKCVAVFMYWQWMYLATPPNKFFNQWHRAIIEYWKMHIHEKTTWHHWLKNLGAESLDTSIPSPVLRPRRELLIVTDDACVSQCLATVHSSRWMATRGTSRRWTPSY